MTTAGELNRYVLQNAIRDVRLIKLELSIITILSCAVTLVNYPIPKTETASTLSDLMEVSGIISGILIAYLSAKVFQVRNERLERQKIIRELYDKLTAFRKILYRVIKSHKFWKAYSDISDFKQTYEDAAYLDLHDFDTESNAAKKVWSGTSGWHSGSIDLFLSMEAIIDEENAPSIWAFDPSYAPSYTLDQLWNYLDPSNQVWYYLEGKYSKYMKGNIDENGISAQYESDLLELAERIDSKFRDIDSRRLLIAEIGSEFHSVYLPDLIELTRQNAKGLPQGTFSLFGSLSLVLSFGVVIPLLMQSTAFPHPIEKTLFVVCISVVIASVLGLLALLHQVLQSEVNIKGST